MDGINYGMNVGQDKFLPRRNENHPRKDGSHDKCQ
jgi:hypothetical protein